MSEIPAPRHVPGHGPRHAAPAERQAVPVQGLRVLAVDDEPPALSELAYLLRQDPRVGLLHTAGDGSEVLRLLREVTVDAVFLDIQMPALSGMELAALLQQFRRPPAIVFVTAHEDYALSAFELDAIDYILKPVRSERLAEAIRRIDDDRRRPEPAAGGGPATVPPDQETIAVELGGVTRFVARSDVRHVEAQGDYARLHTADGSHLVRVPLTTLEDRWADAGFVRIHRSRLVSVRHIQEVKMEAGRCFIRVGDEVLQVSRRHTRALRELVVKPAQPPRGAR